MTINSVSSIDGRVIDLVDFESGQLSTIDPRGFKLVRTAIDTERLLALLDANREVITSEADRERKRIAEPSMFDRTSSEL
jgi:hypothetical protein